MPLGLLAFCLDYGRREDHYLGGVFRSVRERFFRLSGAGLYEIVDAIKEFRNTYIAHQEKELADGKEAHLALKIWVNGLLRIYESHHKSR